jgi:hypothetical protein
MNNIDLNFTLDILLSYVLSTTYAYLCVLIGKSTGGFLCEFSGKYAFTVKVKG